MIIVITLINIALGIIVTIVCSCFRTVRGKPTYIYNPKGKCTNLGCEIENMDELKLAPLTVYRCDKVLPKGKIKWYGLDFDNGIYLFWLIIPLAFLIWPMISNSSLTVNLMLNNYIARMDTLKDRETTLYLTIKGNYNIDADSNTYHVLVDKPVEIMSEINEYNADVKEFKMDIYTQKTFRDNPWIGWFTCPAFQKLDNYNPQATTYRDVLGNELKTFELNNK